MATLTQLLTIPILFPKRQGLTSVFVPSRNEIYIFGGVGEPTYYYSDVYLFTPLGIFKPTLNVLKIYEANTISLVTPTAGGYVARHFHTSTLVTVSSFNLIISIAGVSGSISTRLSDVFCFDVSTNKISTVATSGLVFPKRYGHSATAIGGGNIIVIGGYDAAAFSDIWKLTITSATGGTWSQITVASGTPVATFFHSAAFDSSSNLIYISGGQSSSGVFVPGIYTLNTLTFAWTQVLSSGFSAYGHRSEFINGQVYLFFGYNSGSYLTSIQVYNPSSGLITTLSPAITPGRTNFGSSYDSNTNTVYLMGGNFGSGYLSDVWKLTGLPTTNPPSKSPTFSPTAKPTAAPTKPTLVPTVAPTKPTLTPTVKPSNEPTANPSVKPSEKPSIEPSVQPSFTPSAKPTERPTNEPSKEPTAEPSTERPTKTEEPTNKPSKEPTFKPSLEPTIEPTARPERSEEPTIESTKQPTEEPSQEPTIISTERPTFEPVRTDEPTQRPSDSKQPSNSPSSAPTLSPSFAPTFAPSFAPTWSPTNKNKSSSASNMGLIIGVAAGGSAILLLLLFCYFCWRRRKSSEKDSVDKSSRNPVTNTDIEMVESKAGKNSSPNPSSGNVISSSSQGLNSNSSTNIGEVISWSDIRVNVEDAANAVVGRGSFGSVIRATWERRGMTKKDVAIKVLERRFGESSQQYEIAVERAKQELVVLKFAENQIGTDYIVKAYGLAEGKLSKQLQDMFGMTMNTVGIVMRFEEGGNLGNYLHGGSGGMAVKLNMKEKMSLATGIAQGLSELHSAGIIHGDIKPDNILLDRAVNPMIRFADFGLSTIMEKYVGNGDVSTMRETKHVKGTLMYCAPEMLFNPRNPSNKQVAKASRKTDIFAFGILAWEILTQTRPFKEVSTEGELSDFLHQGNRPRLEELPSGTPPGIVDFFPLLWAQDRTERVSAVETFSTFQFVSQVISKHEFDIFFSHAWGSKPFLSHVFRQLTKLGYRVWYDQNDMGHDLTKSMKDGIMNSKVVLACVSPLYQSRENCMFELREAKAANKNIISLVIEGNPFEWANDEMKEICNFKTKMFVNIGSVSSLPWGSESGGNHEMMEQLKKELQPLLVLLKESNCTPSLNNANNKEFTL